MKKFQLYLFVLFVIVTHLCFGSNTAVTVNGSGQVVNDGSITFTNLITIGALQYPLIDGTSNYVMTTDGAGHLSLKASSGGSSELTNFLSNVPWLTGSGSTAAATISTNAVKIPINVNTDNNAIGLTNFPANIVQTNDAIYVNALTNAFGGTGITSTGSGRTRSFAVDATVVITSRTLSVTAPITGGGDLSANRTFGFDGSQTFNASGATNIDASQLLSNIIPTARYGAEVILTNTTPLRIGTGTSVTTDGIAIGNFNTAANAKSVAVGYSNTVAGTTSGIGVGFGNLTTGARGVAIGLLNTSVGSAGLTRTIAIGASCVATQLNSIAIGATCSATNSGIVMGFGSSANAASLSLGNTCNSSGAGAIALGFSANATNAGSMVVSTATLYSSNDNQFASLFTGGYNFLGGSISGNGFGLTTLNATNITAIIPTASYGAEVVQTNDSVYVNALTNAFGGTGITASGSGRTRSFAVDATVVQTNDSVYVAAVTNVFSGNGISVSTSGRNKTVAIDGTVVQTNNTYFASIVTNDIRSVGATFSGITNVGAIVYQPAFIKGTIIGVYMTGTNAGTAIVDIYKTNSYTASVLPSVSITASAQPSLILTNLYKDTTLTGWGTAVAVDDVFAFKILSNTNSQQFNVTLKIQRIN